ncbi:hypothetical protein A2Z56_01505 [Candidatus Kaiserbacteria bacterium RIFCSPHIGHO2_12_45_16]|nr:MAG: hypothetical protein A2Z56_01505 [Candidatus Kaiserbacteria bacterium RIFCSPHIGHO2_12_45_16]
MSTSIENKAFFAIVGLLTLHAAVKFFGFGMDLYTLTQMVKAVPAILLLGAGYGLVLYFAGVVIYGTSTVKRRVRSLAVALVRGASLTALFYILMWTAHQILHMFV